MPRNGSTFTKGHKKVGGRKPGSRNKERTVREILDALNIEPIEGLALIAEGTAECTVCHGKGKSKYQPDRGNGKVFERQCESCYGSGLERISPQTRVKAYAELAEYMHPKRKSVEVTGTDGGPLKTSLLVEFVDPDHR
jgi:phage/plasmid primase-like uncharacterized protein